MDSFDDSDIVTLKVTIADYDDGEPTIRKFRVKISQLQKPQIHRTVFFFSPSNANDPR